METVRFGKTELSVSRSSFGAIPIQRIPDADAVKILERAYEGGINLFDTARVYTDSEHKIGLAFEGKRKEIIICSKTHSFTREGILEDIEKTLKELKTDYVDVYQLHNPRTVYGPGDEAYDTIAELKAQGVVRHIGLTNHDLNRAIGAVKSGHYATVQYAISPLSSPKEFALSDLCKEHDVGLLAMKALAGGMITNAVTSFVTLREYGNIVPIWGIERLPELEEILSFERDLPEKTEEIEAMIERDRAELCGDFCRGCGYCLPCTAEIPINMAGKMSKIVSCMRKEDYLTPEWAEKMSRIKNCTHCYLCKERCPYGLDTPALLASELEKYEAAYSAFHSQPR